MGKRSSAYWKKRFLEIEKASNAYGLDTFRQIEPAFDKAQREIQNQIESWYSRYAKNNNVTMQEAKRQLSTTELKEFRWDVKEYIKYGRENDLNQMWMKELENASARVHINRLEALKVRTQQALEVAFGNEVDCIDAMARKVFTEDYYHSIFEVQKGFGIGWEIGQIDKRKLETLISKPWAADGKNFSERIWGQRSQLVDELHTQLTRTCILGKAPDDAINAIAKKFNTTKNQAGRLVMTEQAYFHSVAQQEAFEDLDVEEFEIVATLDNSTSEICQEMDGKHFPMKDYQPGVTAPPFHVWCRSVTVPWFEDNYTGERAARDEDGNTYYVPDNMTYEDWKKSMVDGDTSGLKPEPKIDPYSFTEEQSKAIEWYVSGEGQYINQYHRGKIDSDFGELSDMEKQMSGLLDEATDRILPDNVDKLYRSVDASAVFGDMTDDDWYNLEQYINYGGDSFGKGAYADRIRQKAQNTLNKTKGKTITEKGFMSTTKEYDVAANWGDFTGAERPIVLEFDVPKGVKGADLKNFDIEGDEQFEVLLARNTQYKVTNITSKNGQIHVKAEIIPSEVLEEIELPKIKTIDDCQSVEEVVDLFKSKDDWFYRTTLPNGQEFHSGDRINLDGVDLESAKAVYRPFEQVFEKYPQLKGKLNAVNSAQLDGFTMAQCSFGIGHGGIAVNKSYYRSIDKLTKSIIEGESTGFHPKGLFSVDSVVMHELGHAIDDYLSHTLYLAGFNGWKPKTVSGMLRPKVMKAAGFKVSDVYLQVSGYATKDAQEWFAECFSEYMCSENPRPVAKKFGEVLEEILKGVE